MFCEMVLFVVSIGSEWMLIIGYFQLWNMVCFICLGWVMFWDIVWSGWVGSCDFCFSCDACNVRCCCRGRVDVSSCKCCVSVSAVQPVIIFNEVFCVTCSLFRLVSEINGDQMVLAYSILGSIRVLWVARRVSFCFPHEVPVSAFRTFTAFSAFCLVIVVCWLNDRLGSKFKPKILWLLTVGMVILFIVRFSVILCSCVWGVKSVAVDLSGLRSKLLFCPVVYVI